MPVRLRLIILLCVFVLRLNPAFVASLPFRAVSVFPCDMLSTIIISLPNYPLDRLFPHALTSFHFLNPYDQ